MDIEQLQADFTIRGDKLWWARGGRGRRADRPVGTLDQSNGYVVVNYKGGKKYVHRIVFALCNGYLPPEIDHINRDRTDNRPENLRDATRAQNGMNTSLRSDNTNGVKGACYHEGRAKPWQARIQVGGKSVSLGYFRTIDECLSARKAAEKKYFGEFAP